MACPDENAIGRYVQGLMTTAEIRAIDEHVDTCARCAALLSELGRMAAPATVRLTDNSGPSAAGAASVSSTQLSPVGPSPHPVMRQEPLADRTGTQIGRYTVERSLARGGMGEIYLARDPVLDRTVALKLIRGELLAGAGGEEAEQRLVREARAMATLAHPNVLTVHDAGIGNGEVFIVMEYVEGQTLAEWLRSPRPWKDVLSRFLDAGRALGAAHNAGILHRDFKPHNVLIGHDGRVRVMDFGLARSFNPGGGFAQAPFAPETSDSEVRRVGTLNEDPALTQHGTIMGTLAYMAPEQLFGQHTDARADQFSFCVALYEALTGVRPYDGNTLETLRWQIVQNRIQPPTRATAPPRLVETLKRGLAANPNARYPSMAALCEALDGAPWGNAALHLRAHQWSQIFFALVHVGFAAFFTNEVFYAPTASPQVTQATDALAYEPTGSAIDVAAILLVLWAFSALFFIYVGAPWAAFNAIGLRARRRWARVTTLLYAICGISSCVGIPYAVYAAWTLTRREVKDSLR